MYCLSDKMNDFFEGCMLNLISICSNLEQAQFWSAQASSLIVEFERTFLQYSKLYPQKVSKKKLFTIMLQIVA